MDFTGSYINTLAWHTPCKNPSYDTSVEEIGVEENLDDQHRIFLLDDENRVQRVRTT